MTDSSGGEFRNPYAPLPQTLPTGAPVPTVPTSSATVSAVSSGPVAPRESDALHGSETAQDAKRRTGRRAAARTRRADAAQPQRIASSDSSPALETATSTDDPWREITALSSAGPAATRQPPRVGAFTLREVLIVILGLAQLAAGFISVSPGVYHPVVALAALWVMIIAIPGLAVIVTIVRRCWAPHLRIGMFSVDAFIAAASVSALLGWLNVMALGAVAWFGCLLAVGFVVVGLVGSLIPGLREDFTARPAALAHPSDRPLRARAGERTVAGTDAVLISATDAVRSAAAPVRAVTMFPVEGPFRHPVPRVSAADSPAGTAVPPEDKAHVGHGLASAFGSASVDDAPREGVPREADSMGTVARTVESPMSAPASAAGADPGTTADHDRAGNESEASAHRGFWILVPEERIAVDPLGRPMFPVEPSAWTLALEDRGDRLLVRSADGRVGFLTDLTGVIRN